MQSSKLIKVMSHLRVIEVPMLLVTISMLFRYLGNINFFTGVMVYAIIRLFINIRFKISQDKFQRALMTHLDDVMETYDEEEN